MIFAKVKPPEQTYHPDSNFRKEFADFSFERDSDSISLDICEDDLTNDDFMDDFGGKSFWLPR